MAYKKERISMGTIEKIGIGTDIGKNFGFGTPLMNCIILFKRAIAFSVWSII